jgi:hypothetical protein
VEAAIWSADSLGVHYLEAARATSDQLVAKP